MSDLKRAVQMAETLLSARKIVERLESELATAKADVQRLEQEDLPDLMQELGLSKFVLNTGETLEVQPDVTCAITEERRAAAHSWLVDRGFGGLIKTEVVVSFGRGEHGEAEDFANACAEQGKHPNLIERVHPSTLKSFIKEQMAAGTAIPFDVFGVHPFQRVKITAPKR
jgi:hypothetical protein